ncbi:MAG: PAS domain S-box protein [Desulfomonilaceae bacterium]|nr:PAS domain S-box protein [Desulfomonilaceae bacterium]
MTDKKNRPRDAVDDELRDLLQAGAGTETIDLDSLFTKSITDSGSFEIQGEIWTTTFGKLLQAVPVPILLIDRSRNVVAANQGCRKIGAGYETMIGKPFCRLFASPSDAIHSETLVDRVFATRKTSVWEAQIGLGADGMWGRFTFRALRIKGQRFVLVIIEDLSFEKKQILLDRKYRQELEKRVNERTDELRKLNKKLLDEIADRKRSEQALLESERKYKALFDESRDGVYAVLRRGEITAANGAFLEMFGYSRDEAIGLDIHDLYVNPADRATFQSEIEKHGFVKDYEVEFRKKDGTQLSCLLTSSVQYADDGSIIGYRGIVRDDTERKRTEDALQESEKRYRMLFEAASDAIYILQADGNEPGRIISANAEAAQMHGYTIPELLTMNIADLDTPESAAKVRDRMAQLQRGETLREVAAHRRKNGTVFPIEINARLIEVGNRRYILAIDRDVTEREKSQAALRESEQRLRLINDSSPVGVGIVQDGGYVYVNPSFAAMFGYDTAEQIVGLTVETLYASGGRDPTHERRSDSSAGKAVPWHYEAIGITRSGKRFDLEAWGTEIEYLGTRSSLEFVLDVSEAKSLRSQLVQAQKMEAVGTLAGGIAHDFNNLLTIILGYSDLLIAEKDESDKDYEDLKKVIQAARTAGDMVQQILAFSRKTETKLRPINLNTHVQQVRKMLSRLIPKTITVELNLDPDLPTVNADPAQIDQVLINLAVNARDAMPGGGRLSIETKKIVLNGKADRVRVGDSEGPHALLMVVDTGVGMDGATMDRMFDPFFTTKRPGEGTGLGLAMVYGIVKSHEGHISCDSEPGRGTVFTICLPAHQLEGEVEVTTSAEVSATGSGTILLVDDEELVRQLGTRTLEKAGYTVIAVANGQEAVEVFKKKRNEIALVVLDLIMPVMDGNQCLDEILKIDPTAKVLIASGHCPDGSARDALERGAKRLVGKPYNLKDLIKAVREALDSD